MGDVQVLGPKAVRGRLAEAPPQIAVRLGDHPEDGGHGVRAIGGKHRALRKVLGLAHLRMFARRLGSP